MSFERGFTLIEMSIVLLIIGIMLGAGVGLYNQYRINKDIEVTKNNFDKAIEILRKIWSHKRKNGLKNFNQYKYDKYEKVEFDINTIDSALIKSKLFKGMEFIFEEIDTSNITGKSFLPIFINESVYNSYGKNKGAKKLREDLVANKNSGFNSNQNVIAFIKDLYVDYNVYDSYIKIFDKSFVSPISKAAGVSTYNYVLTDSAFIDNKWCYNIIYYPRRKGELTFKGDFWVNDSTFAIKEINMQVSKSANINWVKDIYIEQEFNVLNDSVFLLKRDYMMSDFSLNKKDKSKGLYGKRTTMYKDYQFNKPKEDKFYVKESNLYEEKIYNKTEDYWSINRQEKLNENELGIYKISAAKGNVLVFSSVGFGTKEVTVGASNVINVTLTSTGSNLSEVVVTAMGIRRSDKALGYAVSKVDPTTVLQKSEPDILKGLAGKVPGVDIRSGQGAPGAASRIQIRGVSSFNGGEPLIVVDGIPYSNPVVNTSNPFSGGGAYGSGFGDIDPNDIESINILKGAAAASLYGSRAANGVLLITTKSGAPRKGKKSLNVTYRAGYSQESIAFLPEFQNKGFGFEAAKPVLAFILRGSNQSNLASLIIL